jgi:hypothetical protein
VAHRTGLSAILEGTFDRETGAGVDHAAAVIAWERVPGSQSGSLSGPTASPPVTYSPLNRLAEVTSSFDHRHYVPILKGKKGEFDALGWLDGAAKDAMTPLVEIFTVPWDWDDDVPAKTIEAHLASAAKGIIGGWGPERAIFVDTLWLEPDELAGGAHHLEYLFDLLRGNVDAVPVGGPARGNAHSSAIAAIVAQDSRGACCRLDADDVSDIAGIAPNVDGWLAAIKLTPADVDLVIDFGEVTATNRGAFEIAAGALLPALPHLTDWRSLTLASGAFPRDLSNVPADSEELIDRHDWRLWRAVDSSSVPRKPTFADFAINHPGLFDPDPRTMRPSAGIRYAADAQWLIVKRRWVRHGYDQYRDASQIVLGRPEYCGAVHCRGDAFISACAAGGQTGNLTTWRAVGTSHHVQRTVDAIASLP